MSGLVLMENAGRGCVDVLEREGINGPVVVCCGHGNNAGDGFVIARHLDLRGYEVSVLLLGDPRKLTGDAAANYAILQQAGLAGESLDGADLPVAFGHLADADWLVDALLGTGATGAPRPPLDAAIRWMNALPGRRLAVDVPSGLDCDTGAAADPTLRADVTCTFVAVKPGLLAPAARPYVGRLAVLDIGAPRKLLEEVGGCDR